jgi:hypothetical protein
VGQLGRPSTGTLGQVALGEGLQTPGDAFDQPDLVARAGCFAEELGVATPQVGHGQVVQSGQLVTQGKSDPRHGAVQEG